QRERRFRAGDGDAAGERAQEAAGEAARSARRQRCTRARSRLRGVDQPRDPAGRRWGAGGASPVTEGGGGRPDPGAGRAPPGGEVVSREARALLDRYLRQRRELGETELVLGDRSVRELDLGTPPAVPQRENTAPRPTRQAAPAPPSEAQALALPPAPAVIREEASTCTRCRLATTRTTVVFGEGDPAARVVVVGEAPGAEEDRSGRPFVGRAGKLLDLLLASVGFPRETVYICNV